MTRKWFQIHLSTAIVLMFVAAGLLWANLRVDPATIVTLPIAPQGVTFSPDLSRRVDGYGWPWHCRIKPNVMALPEWNYAALTANSLVVMAILFAVASTCEFLIRRREIKKP